MIEEQHIRFVAAADITDDCLVDIELRKRRMTLTPTQAHVLAAELVAAAERADDATEELRHEHEPAAFDVQHIRPECVAGKFSNCDGMTLTITDEWVPCDHPCHAERGAA